MTRLFLATILLLTLAVPLRIGGILVTIWR